VSKQAEHEDEKNPTVWALLVALFVWLVFDSFFYAILAGCVTYALIERDKKSKDD